jgi:hypothetical protein
MPFLYPRDLIEAVKDAWNKFQGPRKVTLVAYSDSKGRTRTSRKRPERIESGKVDKIPFPSDEALSHLLDSVFHASLLTEEGRRLGIRVAFLPSSISDEARRSDLNCHDLPSKLLPLRSLTPSELLRLVPAINPAHTIILVENAPDTQHNHRSPLVIWGIMHTGTDWWEIVTGRSSGATCPPNLLTISSFAPGQLTVSALGQVLLRLRGGNLVAPPLRGIDEGHIGAFLRRPADDLYAEACKMLRRRRYHEEETSDNHPRTSYYRSVANILRRAREQLHGGTFVIVRDAFSAEDARLRDRINMKYTIAGVSLWPSLITEAVSNRKFFDLLFPRRRQKTSVTGDESREALYRAHCRLEDSLKEISGLETLIATLSGVDGAVILTDRLRVLGFGGEITATSPTLSHVKVTGDSTGRTGVERNIDAFGTRHRSALRFCSSFEDAVCFVISQDGDVRAMKREGSQVFLWSDLDLGRITI